MSGSFPLELQSLLAAGLSGGSQNVRTGRVREILAGNQSLRDALGGWIAQLLSVDLLVPEVYRKWRALVRDSIQFVFSHLSDQRLAAKLVEQIDLPADTPPASRLLGLISKMPGIQKLGQVLARHQRLEASLRAALSELENGMSDANPGTIRAIISKQLGARRLRKYAVKLAPVTFSEASVSAVLRFTWRNPESVRRERGVFKVLKPYVRDCFSEDLALLQQLSEFIARSRGYGFATRHVAGMVSEVRLLLEHELDFAREQATLQAAVRTYRVSLGIRVPRLIAPLSTAEITAMSEERGVKVTEVFPGRPYWRRRVAEQLVEALVTVPLLSRDPHVVFHADPHAGNLLYDEVAGKIVVLDWALMEQLSRDLRRHLALLVIMTVLRNPGGVCGAIRNLASAGDRRDPEKRRLIQERVDRFFKHLPYNRLAGSIDAMQLLDEIALEGVRFPASLAMFQKALFTLDGVLHDIAGSEVSISYLIVRDFVIRLLVSLGLDHPPLSVVDLLAVQRSGLLYPSRLGASALFGIRPETAAETPIESTA
ncbi:MAG TPA: AarF/UbiB family protein [Bryobacteraceae bacterium]|nr:AarF/UbiB family protein [Bryobacteraceae bacterium]